MTDLDDKPFIVRVIKGDKIWNVTIPLASIEECQEYIRYSLERSAAREAERQHRLVDPVCIAESAEILEKLGIEMDQPETPVDYVICRISYEVVQ